MRTNRPLYAALLALLLLAGLAAGCARTPTDADIAGQVQAKINADPNLPNKQITVNASNGVVTLSGTVDTEVERLAAANNASQVPGVKTVVNNLQVAPMAAEESEEQPAPTRAAPARRPARQAVSRSRPRVYEEAAPVAPLEAAAPAPDVAQPVTIPAGTRLIIRMLDGVDTDENQPGDIFRATLDSPITVDERTVLPMGTDIEGRVVELASAGRFKGRSELGLVLTRLLVDGKSYDIQTNEWSKQGSSRGKRTAATVGGGAALGAIIGGIAGGGKGAAIGAAAGAGAGTGVQAATKGEQIVVKPEAVLHFTLEAPVTVTPTAGRDAGRRRLE